jgi:hypothetical protein
MPSDVEGNLGTGAASFETRRDRRGSGGRSPTPPQRHVIVGRMPCECFSRSISPNVVGRRCFLSKSRNASSASSWMADMRSLASRSSANQVSASTRCAAVCCQRCAPSTLGPPSWRASSAFRPSWTASLPPLAAARLDAAPQRIHQIDDIVAISTAARSAMPMIDRPQIASAIESIVCEGDRRTYRNYNHCVRVLGPKYSRHCSRIVTATSIGLACSGASSLSASARQPASC